MTRTSQSGGVSGYHHSTTQQKLCSGMPECANHQITAHPTHNQPQPTQPTLAAAAPARLSPLSWLSGTNVGSGHLCSGSNLWDVLVPLAAQQPPLQSSGRLVGREGVLKLGRAATQCKVSIIPKDGNEVDCKLHTFYT